MSLALSRARDRPVSALRSVRWKRLQRIAAFAALYLIWGSTYLAVALAVRTIPPFLMMGVRSVAAGLVLLALAEIAGSVPRSRRAWRAAALSGALLFLGCHGLLALAQRYVPSGLAAIVFATMPLWLVALQAALGRSRLEPRVLACLVLGALGVATMILGGAGVSGAIDPAMAIVLVISAISWALGSVLAQLLASDVAPMPLSGMQLLSGGVMLLATSAGLGEWQDFAIAAVSLESLAGLLYLIVGGSLVAFTAYLWLLTRVRPALVATYTFVNPIIAVLLGWALLGETIGAGSLIGIALVVGSIAALTLTQEARKAPG
jgi:drug/metabolite transporter (DMT)-like permease